MVVLACWNYRCPGSDDNSGQLASTCGQERLRSALAGSLRKFIRTLSDEELIKVGKRLRILCGDVVTPNPSTFDRPRSSRSSEGSGYRIPPLSRCSASMNFTPILRNSPDWPHALREVNFHQCVFATVLFAPFQTANGVVHCPTSASRG